MLKALVSVGKLTLPPDGQGAARAFSRIGYEIENALADLIDNSIDAGAHGVEITLFRDDKGIVSVSVADDGRGMTAERLHEGMRFATQTSHETSDLGTFGMGMKTASFSQCRSMAVIARTGTTISACRWTHASMRSWACELLEESSASERFAAAYSALGIPHRGGAVVLWEDLDRMKTGVGESDLDEFLDDLLGRLEVHLGLIFHRFISAKRLVLHLTVRRVDRKMHFPRQVRALNPFGYAVSGKPTYPVDLEASMPGLGKLVLSAHVWPARSADPAFLLGRRTGTHAQGFYFYRNDRLVQAGGWNGALPDGNTADLSLARVAVDLPPGGIDVNVQKSAVQFPASAALALSRAHAGRRTFSGFVEDARKVYAAARRVPQQADGLPLTIGAGVPSVARARIRDQVAKKGGVRTIDFQWRTLPTGQVFDLEPAEDLILLNSKYRPRILGGARGSSADVPVVKTLLFLLLREDLKRSRSSQQQVARLDDINRVLFALVGSL
ncbi:ATP-binding protein [Pararoseomonas indoligenes]|uniref:ATP-binding protein n=1 Tax=Roseomonas indoligenes TaxID=2820811 RepID=A0A940N3P5_9PROT|nr:ATP-binding protein [Pararoseomonas indoligenes]MBP0496014.1 ATP-binding protein [Pararoseomonas indoligenes]